MPVIWAITVQTDTMRIQHQIHMARAAATTRRALTIVTVVTAAPTAINPPTTPLPQTRPNFMTVKATTAASCQATVMIRIQSATHMVSMAAVIHLTALTIRMVPEADMIPTAPIIRMVTDGKFTAIKA